jgi:MFS family permease
MNEGKALNAERRRQTLVLGAVFAAMYFAQGITEPTEGLVAQPVRSLLMDWGESVEAIGAFSALLALPWSLKPLYGLLTDFVPLFGLRRKSYLVFTTAACALGFTALALWPLPAGSKAWLFSLLFLPTVAVAFSDVVVDALMVERGQPLGITGRLQSIQWSALYAGTIIAGCIGGHLSETHREQLGFAVCAVAALVTLAVSLGCIRESPVPAAASRRLRETWRALREALRSRTLLGVFAFLTLWNFDPLSSTVLNVHMTRGLGMSESFFGESVSILAAASLAASLAYGAYSRRLSPRALAHLSVVLGIAATAAYFLLEGEASAVWITIVVGLTFMTATLTQLDLAARACPPLAAGTLFAALLAASNFSGSAATWLAGWLYDEWQGAAGARAAFNRLILLGVACKAGCWAFLALLPRRRPPLDAAP